MVSKNKHFLAKSSTRIYLETYLVMLTLIFLFPVLFMLLIAKNVEFLGANMIFFEFNLFLSLVLLVYTYLTRDENGNWKYFMLYFVLSFTYLLSTMMLLGNTVYFQ